MQHPLLVCDNKVLFVGILKLNRRGRCPLANTGLIRKYTFTPTIFSVNSNRKDSKRIPQKGNHFEIWFPLWTPSALPDKYAVWNPIENLVWFCFVWYIVNSHKTIRRKKLKSAYCPSRLVGEIVWTSVSKGWFSRGEQSPSWTAFFFVLFLLLLTEKEPGYQKNNKFELHVYGAEPQELNSTHRQTPIYLILSFM